MKTKVSHFKQKKIVLARRQPIAMVQRLLPIIKCVPLIERILFSAMTLKVFQQNISL